MRLAATPRAARRSSDLAARRAPSAMLYSRVPRSSAWPSMTMRYCLYWFSHCAWRLRMPCASARMTELSVSKKMRSPTLTVKSLAEPGVAAPAPRPRSAALLGVFLLAQPATASVRNNATTSGFLAIAAMRRMPASPSHSSDFVDQPVTTSRLTGVQETWLIFSLSPVREQPSHDFQCPRPLGGNTARRRRVGGSAADG